MKKRLSNQSEDKLLFNIFVDKLPAPPIGFFWNEQYQLEPHKHHEDLRNDDSKRNTVHDLKFLGFGTPKRRDLSRYHDKNNKLYSFAAPPGLKHKEIIDFIHLKYGVDYTNFTPWKKSLFIHRKSKEAGIALLCAKYKTSQKEAENVWGSFQ